MPANPRVRNNNIQGTITDNPLTAAALTMNSAGLANLEAVSTEHAIITLDPLRVSGAPEYVIVTAHTGSATSATITRAAYGSSARQHNLGTVWVHAPVTDDFIRVVDATADITDPYEGQLIYEQDTDIYHAYTGAAWIQALDIGAWDTYVPSNTNITVGNGTETAKFSRMGRTVVWSYKLTFGSTTSFGGTVEVGLPVSASDSSAALVSSAYLIDATGNDFIGAGLTVSATKIQIRLNNSTAVVDATNPFTWTTSDVMTISGTYEAAS